MTPKHAPSYVRNEETGDVTVRPREKLLQRLPSKVGESEALRDIHNKLANWTEVFEHHGDGGRLGVCRAVLDVVDYFASLGIPRATLKPISAVAEAIYDAERGTESRIFRPKRGPGSGKPKRSVGHSVFDGHLVAITECCVRHCEAEGMKPYVLPACRLAAKMINGSRWRVKVTATQLRELRERANQSPRNSPDRLLLEQIPSNENPGCPPLEWAKRLLEEDWVVPLPS